MQYLELYPYINSTLKRLVKSPKGYLLNNGLISYLTGVRKLDVLKSTGLLGHRFENWFLNELLTWTDSLIENHSIHFWRTSGGAEKVRHLRDFLEYEPKAKWRIYLYNGPFNVDQNKKILSLPIWMI